MKQLILTILFLHTLILLLAQKNKLPRAVPTKQQLQWHDMEFYWFTHFGPNTFTDKEWGHGDEPEDVFNPSQLDCRQWARIAKQSGAGGIIITAKHHDGFCLWPSKYSTHTIRESKWKNGKGDVLKELSQACKEYGLKFGVYLSPWDRNHPKYGTPEYNDVFVNMMKEIFQKYGPIWEFWWDGANGEGPNGKLQVYNWRKFENTVRQISPTTIIFSDIGPDIRWVGNEKGIAGVTNWNLLDTAGFTRGAGAPSTDTLNQGNVNGKHWIPAECDVSIRPGWFYHDNEDDKVKTPEQLFDLYLKSVGRGGNLLLNIPPDRSGLIHENDSAALIGFKKLREESFKNNLAKLAKGYFISHNSQRPAPKLNDGNSNTFEFLPATNNSIGIHFSRAKLMNCIILKEYLKTGQNCKKFKLLLMNNKNELIREITGTTIGRKRILSFPAIQVNKIGIVIEDQHGATPVSEIQAYFIEEKLIEK